MGIVVSEFISLDGVVQAPGGPKEDQDGGFRHGGWSMRFFDPEVVGGAYDTLSRECTGLMLGRRTYEVSARAWPRQSGDPFADWINSTPKYAVSDSLAGSDIAWHPTEIVRGADLLDRAARLRAAEGKVLVLGSPSVARALLAADLVDELALMIEPIVLGGGKTIFPDNGEALPFTLSSVVTSPEGVQVCRFVRAR